MPFQFSHQVRFIETQSYSMPDDDEARWTPDPVVGRHDPVVGKWVYIFQTKTTGAAPARGSTVTLHRACYCESASVMRVLDAASARTLASASVPAVSAISLEDIDGTQQCFYYFYVSRIQLGSKSIAMLEGSVSRLLPPVNMPDKPTDPVLASKSWDELPVVDPITIVETFHAAYEIVANDYLVFTTVLADATDDEREKARVRASKRMLSKYLKAVFDGDPDNLLKISDRDTVRSKINDFLNTDDPKVRIKTVRREAVALMITRWLTGSLWQALASTYAERETDVYHEYVEAHANATERLIESSAGKAYLAKFKQVHPKLFNEYLFLQDVVPMNRYPTLKKCGGAVISIFKDLLPFFLTKDKNNDVPATVTAAEISTFLQRLTRLELVKVERFGSVRLSIRSRASVNVVEPQFGGLVRNPDALQNDFETWVKRSKARVNIFNLFLDSANLMVNLNKAFFGGVGKDSGEAVLAHLKVLGSVASVTKAFGGLNDSKWVKGAAGIFSAMIDCVLGFLGGVNAVQRADWPAVLGNILVMGGSVGTVIAGLRTIAGAATAGVWAYCSAVVVAAGAMMIEWWSDTDIDTFVKNCTFGTNHLRAGDAKASWAATPFNTWTDDAAGLGNQVDALFVLIGSFQFKAIGRQAVEIVLGETPLGCKVQVDFKCVYVDYAQQLVTLEPKMVIDPVDGRIESVFGDPADLVAVKVKRGGRTALQVAVDWPNKKPPLPSNVSAAPPTLDTTRVDVRVDMFGNRANLVPASKKLEGLTYLKPTTYQTVFQSTAA